MNKNQKDVCKNENKVVRFLPRPSLLFSLSLLMLYGLYGVGGRPSLLTAASWKAFSFSPAEMNLRLLFIWGKRKK